MDGGPCLDLNNLAPGQWRPASSDEQQRLTSLLRRSHSPGRGGRAGGGKSGRGGGGG
jgi:23S rRNA pseudouridine2457 synthase